MAKQVLHIEKRASVSAALERHNDREEWLEKEDGSRELKPFVPKNADPTRAELNRNLIDRGVDAEGNKLSIQQAVDRRIEEAGVKVRKGQNKALELVLSGGPERMHTMDARELDDWTDSMLGWVRETFGAENVVAAMLHVDETTPHIHAFVVPLVSGQARRTAYHHKHGGSVKQRQSDPSRLRLSADEVFNIQRIYGYHDSLALINARFGLERGDVAPRGSRVEHVSLGEYVKGLNHQAEYAIERRRNAEQDLASLRREIVEQRDKLAMLTDRPLTRSERKELQQLRRICSTPESLRAQANLKEHERMVPVLGEVLQRTFGMKYRPRLADLSPQGRDVWDVRTSLGRQFTIGPGFVTEKTEKGPKTRTAAKSFAADMGRDIVRFLTRPAAVSVGGVCGGKRKGDDDEYEILIFEGMPDPESMDPESLPRRKVSD